MQGIDLNQPLQYLYASMRYFDQNEYHINRLCKYDVLLLVFDGILRFWEDGTSYEISAGTYHIQRQGSLQKGLVASDCPKYLFVHFWGHWADTGAVLPAEGSFDTERFMPLMELLDRLAHRGATLTEQISVFTELLSRLYRCDRQETPAARMAEYIGDHLSEPVNLEQLGAVFHFSKNHIINLFKQEHGVTPTEYLNTLRLQKAMHLLEATSASAESIAAACGYHTYSHFYRLFLRKTGIAPTLWRQQKRLAP